MVEPTWDSASTVSDLCLSFVNQNAAELPQISANESLDLAGAIRLGNDVDVSSKKIKKALVLLRFGLCGKKRLVLAEGVEHGHHGVALLSPCTLADFMGFAKIVFPEVRGRVPIKLKHEGEHRVTARN